MRNVLSLVIALAVGVSPAAAQARPDFSGKWSLDPKSAPPGMPQGSMMVVTLKQDEKTLNVDLHASSPLGEARRTSVLSFDGAPAKTTVTASGQEMALTSTATWEGSILAVMTSGDIAGYAMVQTDRWSLDPDGKTLQLETTVSAAGQKQTSKLTFIKQ